MASATIANDQDPDRATLVVHAPLEALFSDTVNCEVAGGPLLHPETVRRLACDARLQYVLNNREGNAVGIGTTSSAVPQWLRRQVLHRDGHMCTFPNCERKAFLHPHHIVHAGRQGPTDLENLTTLCSFHHRLVHEGRWSVARSPNGKLTWFRPSGRVYEAGPAPPTSEEAEIQRCEVPAPTLLEARRNYPWVFRMVELFAGT
jgi:hypothetical protein